jgi:hypothetical protein
MFWETWTIGHGIVVSSDEDCWILGYRTLDTDLLALSTVVDHPSALYLASPTRSR